MESMSKTEALKPVFLKVGIPLALSLAGFIFAKLMAKINSPKSCLSRFDVHNVQDNTHFREELIPQMGDEDCIESTSFEACLNLDEKEEEEILGLRSMFEDIKTQFTLYQDLKEQESKLVEIKTMLLLETTVLKFLDMEISSMEAEKKRFKNFVLEFMKALKEIEYWKSENGLLERKMKESLRIVSEQYLTIEVMEEEVLGKSNELERRNEKVKKLEENVRGLEMMLVQVQDENKQMLRKIEEGIKIEDYNKAVNELERLHRDRAVEYKELIFLRWSNACLRHELMRYYEQQQHEKRDRKENHLEQDIEHFLGDSGDGDRACSGRRKFLHRIRRWVPGGQVRI